MSYLAFLVISIYFPNSYKELGVFYKILVKYVTSLRDY